MHWSRAPSLISCLLQHPRPSPAFTTVRSFSKLNSRHPSTQHCTTYKTVHISLRCVCNSISAHPNIPRIPYLHIPSPRRPPFSNTQAAISQLQSHRSNWPNRQYWLCCCSCLFGFIIKERTDAHTLYPPLFGRKYVVFYSLCVNCGVWTHVTSLESSFFHFAVILTLHIFVFSIWGRGPFCSLPVTCLDK